MAVMEPHNSHLGGDAFIQFWDAQAQQALALNGSGDAPSGATCDAMGSEIPLCGIRAAAVPGAVDGWLTALETWGTMTREEVLSPAIALADDGYALPAWQVQILQDNKAMWADFPDSGACLAPDELLPGATLYQPVLAGTLRQIAAGGRAAFYEGEFAEKLVSYSEENGGFFTKGDLANHHSLILEPLQTTYRGVTVLEQPPVSQGHILLQILNILEGFDVASMHPEGATLIHIMAEAKKLAFADRMAYMGDRAGVPLSALLSKDYAAQQRNRINAAQAAERCRAGRLPTSGNYGSDTTSLCVVDARGNAVSLIQSVFHRYGCGVVVPSTGVLLNNRMRGFSLDPQNPNCLQAGKKPMHTLNTWMLHKGGRLWAVGGSPGGDVQVQTNAQTISQMIDHERSPQEAIESPKWHVPPDGAELIVEDRLPLDTCYELRKLGHRLTVNGPWSGSCASQIIMLDPETGALFGGSDPRVEGLALGY